MRLLTSRLGVRASLGAIWFCCVDELSLRAIALGPPAQSMPPGLPPGASRPKACLQACLPVPRGPKHASRPASRCLPPRGLPGPAWGLGWGAACFFFAEQDNFKPQCLPTASGVSSSSWAGPMSSSPLQHRRHCSHFGSRFSIGLLLQSRPFVFFYVANQQNPLIPLSTTIFSVSFQNWLQRVAQHQLRPKILCCCSLEGTSQIVLCWKK